MILHLTVTRTKEKPQIAAGLFCVTLTYVTSKKAKLFDSDDDETETTDSDTHLAVERYKSEPGVDQDTCSYSCSKVFQS